MTGLAALQQHFAAYSRRLALHAEEGHLPTAFLIELLEFAAAAARTQGNVRAIELLEQAVAIEARDARLWFALGIAQREEQRPTEALAAIVKAKALAPHDPQITLADAQIHFETGLPAANRFAMAKELSPDNLFIVRNQAAALAAEGAFGAAEALLSETLVTNQEWIDGHKALTTMRATYGQNKDFARSFEIACKAQPKNQALRLAWFHVMASARHWDDARAIVADGQTLIGDNQAFALARIFIASESGEGANDLLIESVASIEDTGLDLCRVRYWLKVGKPDRAEAICLRQISTPAANAFWPYLSIIWRLKGDSRSAWLDGEGAYICAYDLKFTESELGALAACLRSLHTMKAPYFEQSVRGGTQTDRPIFMRPDREVQEARARILEAVSDYIERLPAPDTAHPLLKHARNQIKFAGSWSVRLSAQGFHACHTHPLGWISSAFYVALPKQSAGHAGWLSLGTPPPELNLDLDATAHIEPKPGRLVLFPSTMWHSTRPFDDGERLSIAFDIAVPR
jgi:Flp pilus assembly protein TadD